MTSAQFNTDPPAGSGLSVRLTDKQPVTTVLDILSSKSMMSNYE